VLDRRYHVDQVFQCIKHSNPFIKRFLSDDADAHMTNSSNNLRLGGSPPRGSSRLSVQAMVVDGGM
jgi:hypothetical protein